MRYALPMALDYEGVENGVDLVVKGVCAGVMLKKRRRAATAPTVAGRTGHGLPARRIVPLNMVMEAGTAGPREELDRRLERGLLVTHFHYTNRVHPKLAIVTGMTATEHPGRARNRTCVRDLRLHPRLP